MPYTGPETIVCSIRGYLRQRLRDKQIFHTAEYLYPAKVRPDALEIGLGLVGISACCLLSYLLLLR